MIRIKPRVSLGLCMLAILATTTTSCLKMSTPEEFDDGTIDNATSTYSNKYMGLSLTLPKTWFVQDSQTQKMLTDTGKKMATGNNKALQDAYDSSMANNHMLLTLFKHPVSQATDFNPSLIVNAEKISPGLRIQRGRDYIEQTRKTMEKGAMQIPFKDAGSESLGGVVFDKAEASYQIGKVTLTQIMYATVRKGYALAMIATYVANEDGATIDQVIKSAKFK